MTTETSGHQKNTIQLKLYVPLLPLDLFSNFHNFIPQTYKKYFIFVLLR